MHPRLNLKSKEPSLIIVERRRRTDIVVGVPHHASAGAATLPCKEHPDADENAGFLGRYLAEKIESCNVIACNFEVDANKSEVTDYTKQIID